MKGWSTVVALLLSLALVGSIACNPFGGTEPETRQQLVEVVRGDLTITVSGSGNIAVSRDMKLAFGIAGRVDKIYVAENDEVSQGEALARLETDALELALTQAKVTYIQAQVTVTQAKVTYIQAQVTVTQAEVAITRAQAAHAQAQAAVTQAQVAVQTAEYERDKAQKAYTLSDIKVAQADIDVAKSDLEEALGKVSKYLPGSEGATFWQKAVIQSQARLDAAKDRLEAMLSGSDTAEVAIKKRQVTATQQSLEATRQSLEATRQSLELAKLSPEVAKQSLELAQQSLEQAQKQLDKATLVAPFAGVVARLYAVNEGDTISTATTILYLVDPSRMELKVQVDEIDIPEVKLGQRAIIEVDALPALPLVGQVSSISLLPAVDAGVITYDVKIDLALPEGVGLRVGMSATTDIIINERSHVLLVPSRAIHQDRQGNPLVEVMVNGRIEPKTVVTGISNDLQTEIVQGLNEGETVVMVIKKKVKP